MKLIEFLQENGVNQKLVDDAVYFRDYYKVDENYRDRIPELDFFMGKMSGKCASRHCWRGKTY